MRLAGRDADEGHERRLEVRDGRLEAGWRSSSRGTTAGHDVEVVFWGWRSRSRSRSCTVRGRRALGHLVWADGKWTANGGVEGGGGDGDYG